MEVCLVTPKFNVGESYGGEVSVRLIADELERRGLTVRILAEYTEGEDSRVIRVPMAPRPLAEGMRGADIVHGYNMNALIATGRAARLAGVPAVITANSYWATCLFGDMDFPDGEVCTGCSVAGLRRDFATRNPLTVGRRVPALVGRAVVAHRTRELARYHRVVALSEATKRQLISAGVRADRITIIPNVADQGSLGAVPGSLPEDPHVLFVGALKHAKGPQVLVRAMPALGRLVPGAHATLVGDGPEAGPLAAEAGTLGLSEAVSLPGRKAPGDIIRLYQRARVFALPVLWEEPFPRVLFEAWGHGVPFVTSTRGGPGEVVEEGVSGLRTRPGDPEDLAHALASVLQDRTLAERLRAGGLKALQGFHPDKILPRLIELYESVAGAGGSTPQAQIL